MSFERGHEVPHTSAGAAPSGHQAPHHHLPTTTAPPPVPTATLLPTLIPPLHPPYAEPFRGHAEPFRGHAGSYGGHPEPFGGRVEPSLPPSVPRMPPSIGPIPSLRPAEGLYNASASLPVSSSLPDIPPVPVGYADHTLPSTQPPVIHPIHSPDYDAVAARQQPRSFTGLMQDVISHPAFALVFKKVAELSVGHEVVIPELAESMRNTSLNSASLRDFARANGINSACVQSSTFDVFMVALLAAIDNLKTQPSSHTISPVLQNTVVACSQLTASAAGGASAGSGAVAGPSTAQGSAGPSQPFATYARTTGGPRPKLSVAARTILEDWFKEHYDNPYPTEETKLDLASRCGIRLNQVNNFFGNKRMRIKRKIIATPAEPDATGNASNEPKFDASAVLAPRTKWRAIVLSQPPSASGGAAPGSSQAPATGPVARPVTVPGVGAGTASQSHGAVAGGLFAGSPSVTPHGATAAGVPHAHGAVAGGSFMGSASGTPHGENAKTASAPRRHTIEDIVNNPIRTPGRDYSGRNRSGLWE